MGLRTIFQEIFAPQGVIYDGEADAHFTNDRPPVRRPPVWAGYAPSREEFAAWRADPATLFAFAALEAAAEAQKAVWDTESWGRCQANPLLLMELRTRADAYRAMQEADYEGFCEWLGVEPEAPQEETNAA